MIHVLSEVAAMLGITFYFSQQNKRLKGYIEDLAQRMEEQEDLIQRHEELLKALTARVGGVPEQRQNVQTVGKISHSDQQQMQQIQQMQQMQQMQQVPWTSGNNTVQTKQKRKTSNKEPVVPPRPKVTFEPQAAPLPSETAYEDYGDQQNDNSTSEESDMDIELQEELAELSGSDNESDNESLKKGQ